jgi:hypothetical protein
MDLGFQPLSAKEVLPLKWLKRSLRFMELSGPKLLLSRVMKFSAIGNFFGAPV